MPLGSTSGYGGGRSYTNTRSSVSAPTAAGSDYLAALMEREAELLGRRRRPVAAPKYNPGPSLNARRVSTGRPSSTISGPSGPSDPNRRLREAAEAAALRASMAESNAMTQPAPLRYAGGFNMAGHMTMDPTRMSGAQRRAYLPEESGGDMSLIAQGRQQRAADEDEEQLRLDRLLEQRQADAARARFNPYRSTYLMRTIPGQYGER